MGTSSATASTRSPTRSTPLDPRLPDPPPLLPMLKILLPKCCQTPMWSTWPPTRRKVKPQVRRQIRLAPPARFELALPPPEGGALSPELRGPASVGQALQPRQGRRAMYQDVPWESDARSNDQPQHPDIRRPQSNRAFDCRSCPLPAAMDLSTGSNIRRQELVTGMVSSTVHRRRSKEGA